MAEKKEMRKKGGKKMTNVGVNSSRTDSDGENVRLFGAECAGLNRSEKRDQQGRERGQREKSQGEKKMLYRASWFMAALLLA
jgi:hypothetical protein